MSIWQDCPDCTDGLDWRVELPVPCLTCGGYRRVEKPPQAVSCDGATLHEVAVESTEIAAERRLEDDALRSERLKTGQSREDF